MDRHGVKAIFRRKGSRTFSSSGHFSRKCLRVSSFAAGSVGVLRSLAAEAVEVPLAAGAARMRARMLRALATKAVEAPLATSASASGSGRFHSWKWLKSIFFFFFFFYSKFRLSLSRRTIPWDVGFWHGNLSLLQEV